MSENFLNLSVSLLLMPHAYGSRFWEKEDEIMAN